MGVDYCSPAVVLLASTVGVRSVPRWYESSSPRPLVSACSILWSIVIGAREAPRGAPRCPEILPLRVAMRVVFDRLGMLVCVRRPRLCVSVCSRCLGIL